MTEIDCSKNLENSSYSNDTGIGTSSYLESFVLIDNESPVSLKNNDKSNTTSSDDDTLTKNKQIEIVSSIKSSLQNEINIKLEQLLQNLENYKTIRHK
ncbi:unnamed protein product [Brachionus calyciflorus]|uniref:Uncharacterized protein n=1 Tax=Brachionus calyciflorus TaxID=104777 RepID=A0A813NDW7_9BILA|nr:unnamed protein product [Brachionus calyciflorus]